jgi:hypothetical protein
LFTISKVHISRCRHDDKLFKESSVLKRIKFLLGYLYYKFKELYVKNMYVKIYKPVFLFLP